jgi:pepF/M3 family oligoendopeptidase
MPAGSEVPRWDLDSVYPGFQSDAYKSDRKAFVKNCKSILKTLEDKTQRKKEPKKWIKQIVGKINAASALHENLSSYLGCAYSVDTTNSTILSEINSLDEDALLLSDAMVRFRTAIKPLRKQIRKLAAESKSIREFEFFLSEQVELANRQMSIAEESLAADLSRSGSDAWGRLQETVSSTLDWPWAGKERKTVVQLRSLAMDPDRGVREKAYRKELDAWESMKIPLAASINGVKGFAVSLDRRRNFESSLDHAAMLSRISRKTLDAQIETMQANLDVFRRYLNAKASLIGVKKLAFFDLFAPVGNTTKSWTFAEAGSFIVEQFSSFSAELGEFAQRAFDHHWIDAEPREGKVGGAFCAGMPVAKQSRILANFDGSFDSVFTLAHELGHAYHGHVISDLPALNQEYPMTLAETASIFCETIVFSRAMNAGDEQDRITVLELFLQSSTQVVVDILSRFLFERSVFKRRASAELSPEELCELMIEAQRATYGDGLDESALHPYMWAAKPHYYSAELSFYNFPYAFGMLFGLGLYASYQQDEKGFPDRYKKLLRLTGTASANEVTRQAGFDIEDPAFWQSGIDIIASYVDQFESLIAGKES